MSGFIPLSKIPNFDPLAVPVIAWDTHLPAITSDRLTAPALRERFAQSYTWEPEVRAEPRFTDREPRQAAVLIAIMKHERPSILLTQRTEKLSAHAGQIAFAGGKVDAGETAVEAALREAWEEVGLPVANAEVLGELPPYTTGTAFCVTPVVALIEPLFEPQLNRAEVADLFEVPLDFLMNPAHHARHQMQYQGHYREWFSMPWQDKAADKQRFVWGATAGMLRNLYRFLAAKPLQ